MILIVLACLVLGLVFLYKQFVNKSYEGYWERLGIPVMGSIKDEINFDEELLAERYKTLKAQGKKHVGLYDKGKPNYMPIDMDLVKAILQKDFVNFMNHGTGLNMKLDPLNRNLFHMEDEQWKYWRNKLSPTFTSGKMKMMFHTMVATTGGLVDLLEDQSGDAIDIRETLARFSTDVIASCAFGIEANCLKNPDSEIRKCGRDYFNAVRVPRRGIIPSIRKIFGRLKVTPPHVEEFFSKLVEDTVKYREDNDIYRKDFIHMMLQLKNIGEVTDDGKIKKGGKVGNLLEVEDITGQAFVFFLAGFETSSTTMSFAIYELATNPDIQDKLRAEIEAAFKKSDGKIDYDMVMQMTYLDQIVYETLRKHPPLRHTMRKCNKDWEIPGHNIVIKAGTGITIPIECIHMDPKYYPNPEKFDPERFSPENKAKIPAYAFLAFGEGPRICIGLRFGLLQTKIGLITIFRNFKISLNKKTKEPLEFEKFLMPIVKGGIWVDVKKVT